MSSFRRTTLLNILNGLLIVSIPFLFCISPSFSQPNTDWTDDVITDSTPIRSIHINELRQEINDFRQQCINVAPITFTDTITPGVLVRDDHIEELRTAIQGIYDAYPPRTNNMDYVDGTDIIPGVTHIKADHVQDLRDALDSSTCCGDGGCQTLVENCNNCIGDCN